MVLGWLIPDFMNPVSKLSLLFHTIRYITLWQMIYRGRAMVLRRWRMLRGQRAPIVYGIELNDFVPLYESCQAPFDHEGIGGFENAFERGVGITEGRFCFLHQDVCYADEIEWHDPKVSQLWRYHLHYFDYVEDLIVLGLSGKQEKAWLTFKILALSWMIHNNAVKGDGWHPYTLSLRIVNWLNASGYWRDRLDADLAFQRRFLASLYGQARYLAENLEYDVRGNHLLKNIKALLWAGTALAGGEAAKWRQKGMKLLEKELNEQVLSDGGHFERSPGYHGVVLADCMEIGLWLRRNEGNAPQWLDEVISRMLDFLKSIFPADHQQPLLKDTVRGEGRTPAALLSAGAVYLDRPQLKVSDALPLYPWLLFGKRGRQQFSQYGLTEGFSGSKPLSESCFFVLRDDEKRDYLVFDAGKPCPDYLPAHAHADLFSYELMVDGQRVVVDSGVYEYAAGQWRDYFRSTRAHNTVEIAGKNQSEVWGSFRVARRARPGLNNYTDSKERTVIDVWHDGYQRLGIPVMHRRVLWWEKGLFWFRAGIRKNSVKRRRTPFSVFKRKPSFHFVLGMFFTQGKTSLFNIHKQGVVCMVFDLCCLKGPSLWISNPER